MGFKMSICAAAIRQAECLNWVQAVWKRFSYPNNCKQPGAMDLEATG
jgi:hypothetical protein